MFILFVFTLEQETGVMVKAELFTSISHMENLVYSSSNLTTEFEAYFRENKMSNEYTDK